MTSRHGKPSTHHGPFVTRFRQLAIDSLKRARNAEFSCFKLLIFTNCKKKKKNPKKTVELSVICDTMTLSKLPSLLDNENPLSKRGELYIQTGLRDHLFDGMDSAYINVPSDMIYMLRACGHALMSNPTIVFPFTAIFLYANDRIQRIFSQDCGYWCLACRGNSSHNVEYIPMGFQLFIGETDVCVSTMPCHIFVAPLHMIYFLLAFLKIGTILFFRKRPCFSTFIVKDWKIQRTRPSTRELSLFIYATHRPVSY